MTIENTPLYDRNTHPMEAWKSWYTRNEAEIKEIHESDKLELRVSILIGQQLEKGVLYAMRYIQRYEYTNILQKQRIWSPLLNLYEKREFELQLMKFYKDNGDKREPTRPRPQSIYNHGLTLITIDFNPLPPTLQPSTSNQSTIKNLEFESTITNDPTVMSIVDSANHQFQVLDIWKY